MQVHARQQRTSPTMHDLTNTATVTGEMSQACWEFPRNVTLYNAGVAPTCTQSGLVSVVEQQLVVQTKTGTALTHCRGP
jgi:hypothetical protein